MVYYFEKPTIGYCSKCDKIATYNEQVGLYCPKCKSENVSIFEWDGEDPYPE